MRLLRNLLLATLLLESSSMAINCPDGSQSTRETINQVATSTRHYEDDGSYTIHCVVTYDWADVCPGVTPNWQSGFSIFAGPCP